VTLCAAPNFLQIFIRAKCGISKGWKRKKIFAAFFGGQSAIDSESADCTGHLIAAPSNSQDIVRFATQECDRQSLSPRRRFAAIPISKLRR
jgi:hypothetical protein